MVMLKVAIFGKANSGKDTTGKLLFEEFSRQFTDNQKGIEYIAFADPIKKIAKIMFPNIPDTFLYGSSSLRKEIIPNAFKNGKPLTVRQLLIDIGTGLGRTYQEDIWLNVIDNTLLPFNDKNIVITDGRYVNEFNHLKKLNFKCIRLLRNEHLQLDDVSETNQDEIRDDQFDFILHNNGTLDDLRSEVSNIIEKLKN